MLFDENVKRRDRGRKKALLHCLAKATLTNDKSCFLASIDFLDRLRRLRDGKYSLLPNHALMIQFYLKQLLVISFFA